MPTKLVKWGYKHKGEHDNAMDNQNNQNDPNNQPTQANQSYPPSTNQPIDGSTPIPPTPVATNYSPINPSTQPTIEQNPQPLNQTPQPYAAQQPSPIQGAQNASVVKKRSLAWLWITLAVIVVLAISVVATVLISVNNANSVAKTYSSSLKVYLNDVADTISGSSSSPDGVVKKIDDIKKPVLESAFLSNLSPEYKEAQTNSQIADSVVLEAKTEAELYDNLYIFYTDLTSESEEIVNGMYLFASSGNDVNLAINRLNNLSTTCNNMVKLTDNTKLPEKSQPTLVDTQSGIRNMCISLDDLETAIRANDQNGAGVAVDNLQTASQEFDSAHSMLKKDYEEVASNVKELAKPVQELADKL